MKTWPRVRRKRAWRNLPIVWNWTEHIENIPDLQQCVYFRKSQKVVNHFTLLHNLRLLATSWLACLIPIPCFLKNWNSWNEKFHGHQMIKKKVWQWLLIKGIVARNLCPFYICKTLLETGLLSLVALIVSVHTLRES